MRIKKFENGNTYFLTQHNIWVRDFTQNITAVDVNKVTNREDYNIIIENEIENNTLDLAEIDVDKIRHSATIIVSDGYDFENKQHLLKDVPKNVVIIATNKVLAKWKVNRKIDYFVVNNPYQECMLQLPNHKYYPSCVASTRTNHEFLKEYDRRGGVIYKYSSVREEGFSPTFAKTICSIDDYRNPICAAIGLSYKFSASRILLFCCDGSFAQARPGAEQLSNGFWMYPQQRISHDVTDAMLHWYSKHKVKLGNHSSGPEYNNAPYISENQLIDFFN